MCLSFGLLTSLGFSSDLSAQSLWVFPGSSFWDNETGWNPVGVPGITTDVQVNNGGQVRVNNLQSANSLVLGNEIGEAGYFLVETSESLFTVTSQIVVGRYGNSVFVNDRGFVRTSNVILGSEVGSQGTLTLAGTPGDTGIFETGYMQKGDGNGQLYWNGGILRASSDEADFLRGFGSGDVQLLERGGIFDTQGFSVGIDTVISGTGSFTKLGSGELTLFGDNTYTGGTHLMEGTLLVGHDNALGSGLLTMEDGTTIGATGMFEGFLENDVVLKGDINIHSDFELSFSGTMNLGNATRTVTLTEDSFTVAFAHIIGNGGLNLVREGGSEGGAIVGMFGSEDNTYTGLTTVGSGVALMLFKSVDLEVLESMGGIGGIDDIGSIEDLPVFGTDAVAIPGDLWIQDGASVIAFELGAPSVTQIAPTSSVLIEGEGSLMFLYIPWEIALDDEASYSPMEQTLAGLYGDGTLLNMGGDLNLTVLEGNFSGNIMEWDLLGLELCGCEGPPLALFKNGPGTLLLSGENMYYGGTTINEGRLQTNNFYALGDGPVMLQGGILEPVSDLEIYSLHWSGGKIARTLDSEMRFLAIWDDLTVDEDGGAFAFAPGEDFFSVGSFDLLSAFNLDSSMLDLFSGNQVFGMSPIFLIEDNTLMVQFEGIPVFSGPLLQNSAPVFIPIWSDFIVIGNVTTGTIFENNTIHNLIFHPGSHLHIYNTLIVNNGNFIGTGGGIYNLTGGNIYVPNIMNIMGGGIFNFSNNVFVNNFINIINSTVHVNGIFNTNTLTVFQNSILAGNGIINGNVINNGIISPGNSPGVLTINGNLTQSGSGTLLIEIASPNVYDRLVVSGRAHLDGTLRVANLGSKLKYGQQYHFLQAGSIHGEFDRILMPNPSRYRGRFFHDNHIGTLLVAPTSYTLVAETPNQRRVAKALDAFIPERGNDRETVSFALDLQSEEQYPYAFDQIAPTFYETLGTITTEQAFSQTQTLNQRFSSVRLGVGSFQAIGIEPQPLVYDKNGKSVVAPVVEDPTHNWSLWAMGTGSFAKVERVHQLPSYDYDTGGVLVGADYRWSENFVTGLYGGYQHTHADYDASGRLKIDSALFGGYALYQAGGFYADGVIGGGYHDYNARRSITFSTIDRTARSRPDGGQFTTSLNLGYDWKVKNFHIGPVGGLQYTRVGIDGFTESGADSLNLRLRDQSIDSFRSTLGGRIAYTAKINERLTLIPEARVLWQHEFANDARMIDASFDDGSVFGYETSDPSRDGVFIGVGLNAQMGDRWTAHVYYNVDVGRSDHENHIISGGINWKF